MLLNRKPSAIETYNDVNGKVVNVFKVLRDNPAEFIDALLMTPYSKKEYDEAWFCEGDTAIEKARKFFIRTQQSIWASGAQDKTKGWSSSIRDSRVGKSDKISRWINAVNGLPEVITRLLNVQLECRDYKFILSKYDDSEVLFYMDSPYDKTFRSSSPYEFDFVNQDFFEMLYHVKNIKGKAAISGYNSEFMMELFKDLNFVKGPARKNTRSDKPAFECLWTNY